MVWDMGAQLLYGKASRAWRLHFALVELRRQAKCSGHTMRIKEAHGGKHGRVRYLALARRLKAIQAFNIQLESKTLVLLEDISMRAITLFCCC